MMSPPLGIDSALILMRPRGGNRSRRRTNGQDQGGRTKGTLPQPFVLRQGGKPRAIVHRAGNGRFDKRFPGVCCLLGFRISQYEINQRDR